MHDHTPYLDLLAVVGKYLSDSLGPQLRSSCDHPLATTIAEKICNYDSVKDSSSQQCNSVHPGM